MLKWTIAIVLFDLNNNLRYHMLIISTGIDFNESTAFGISIDPSPTREHTIQTVLKYPRGILLITCNQQL